MCRPFILVDLLQKKTEQKEIKQRVRCVIACKFKRLARFSALTGNCSTTFFESFLVGDVHVNVGRFKFFVEQSLSKVGVFKPSEFDASPSK